jgi:hypothetical protein
MLGMLRTEMGRYSFAIIICKRNLRSEIGALWVVVGGAGKVDYTQAVFSRKFSAIFSIAAFFFP